MSNLKRGRPQKSTDKIVFNVGSFAETLRHCSGEEFSKWALKNEWVTFSKRYFSCAYPKDKYIRVSYDLLSCVYPKDRYIRGLYDLLSCVYPNDRYIRGSYD